MGRLRTVVEVTYEEDGDEKKGNYYMLHWGLKYDLLPDSYGQLVPVHYTVAICQNIQSGLIETFLPEQLRVIGMNVKDE